MQTHLNSLLTPYPNLKIPTHIMPGNDTRGRKLVVQSFLASTKKTTPLNTAKGIEEVSAFLMSSIFLFYFDVFFYYYSALYISSKFALQDNKAIVDLFTSPCRSTMQPIEHNRAITLAGNTYP